MARGFNPGVTMIERETPQTKRDVCPIHCECKGWGLEFIAGAMRTSTKFDIDVHPISLIA